MSEASAAATAIAAPPPAPPLAEVQGLVKWYSGRGGLFARAGVAPVRAIDGVDLAVWQGECLAVVGESGSGKTTLGRCMVRLVEPTAGRVRFDGEDLLGLRPAEVRRRRRRFQMVFQDPDAALDPRQRAGAVLAEALRVHGRRGKVEERGNLGRVGDLSARAGLGRRGGLGARGDGRQARVAELLATVGLAQAVAGRYPHELSGGQRQRLGIARALAVEPELVIADEPVAALDASVRAQVLNLLFELRLRMGLTLLLIAHDLAAVEQMADRVAVLYLGRVVELAQRSDLFARPLHPYTASLLSAVPVPVPPPPGARGEHTGRIVLDGEPPSPSSPPPGCPFHPRCPIARPRCASERPPLAPPAPLSAPAPLLSPIVGRASPGPGGLQRVGGEARLVACFYPGELQPRRGQITERPPAS
ncbi:MAG TPA: ABC transporter ATP-binding protein [Thermoanaerobaculia bacterium]|nr:ABC transporter ATP-binding protein [Thermoanaerobaculia bacterium]